MIPRRGVRALFLGVSSFLLPFFFFSCPTVSHEVLPEGVAQCFRMKINFSSSPGLSPREERIHCQFPRRDIYRVVKICVRFFLFQLSFVRRNSPRFQVDRDSFIYIRDLSVSYLDERKREIRSRLASNGS